MNEFVMSGDPTADVSETPAEPTVVSRVVFSELAKLLDGEEAYEASDELERLYTNPDQFQSFEPS